MRQARRRGVAAVPRGLSGPPARHFATPPRQVQDARRGSCHERGCKGCAGTSGGPQIPADLPQRSEQPTSASFRSSTNYIWRTMTCRMAAQDRVSMQRGNVPPQVRLALSPGRSSKPRSHLHHSGGLLHERTALITLIAVVGLACASYADSGAVTLTIYKAGWILGGSGGSGTLYFHGRTYTRSRLASGLRPRLRRILRRPVVLDRGRILCPQYFDVEAESS